jgi:hypothetical protein
MRAAFARFSIGLQAVTRLVQQLGNRAFSNRMILPRQFRRQAPRALARPAQRRLRIATCRRLDQRFQGRHQPGVRVRHSTTTASRPTNAPRFRSSLLQWKVQFPHPSRDGGTRQSGGRRNGRHTAPTTIACFRGSPLPPPALIQFGEQRTILAANSCDGFGIQAALVIAQPPPDTKTNL